MVRESIKCGDIPASREAYAESFKIALPAIIEMVSIAFIGMADTVMVGRLGPYAVAAVGLTNQPRMVFMSVFFALNVGVTAIVSRRKGQGDQGSARSCVRQSLLIALSMVVFMTLAAFLLADPMMRLAGANDDTLIASIEYFRIIGLGLVFSVLSGMLCAAQRAIGNTRITLRVNIAANVINVVLNFLMIEGRFGFPRLEVRGAAIATVIGTAVGLGLALWSLLPKDAYLHISVKDDWRPDIPMIKSIAKIGGGSMIEQLAFRVGFFSYARIVANLGTNDFASHQIAMQLMNLSFTFADGIGAATTSLVGQNLGKKRPDLSIMYGHIGQRFALLISIFLCILSFSGRFFFPTLFTTDTEIIATTAGVITILAFIQPVQTSQIVMAGSLRGAGDTRFVAMTMLLTVTVIRPITSMVLIYGFHMGLIGAWLAIVIDQIVRLFMVFTRFSRGKWIRVKV